MFNSVTIKLRNSYPAMVCDWIKGSEGREYDTSHACV